ncbi:hypothetical protein K5D44_03785 [Pseudomonas cichorii]|nr:hypothetical protein [Pseudomonas cichorii]MBX8563802.1 hypothetical protein [Pseudomonas cichorii]
MSEGIGGNYEWQQKLEQSLHQIRDKLFYLENTGPSLGDGPQSALSPLGLGQRVDSVLHYMMNEPNWINEFSLYDDSAEPQNETLQILSRLPVALDRLSVAYTKGDMDDSLRDTILQFRILVGQLALILTDSFAQKRIPPSTELGRISGRVAAWEEMKWVKPAISSLEDRLKKADARLAALTEELDKHKEIAASALENISTSHESVLATISEKNDQLDEMLGTSARRVIAGDYEKSAEHERKVSDYLRYGSLSCMAFIFGLLGFTLWETTQSDPAWTVVLFRGTLTFLLSVPAAYLARESTKHRQQQYQHQQMALDLKAMPPFLASLSSEDQNKFKLDMAARIFGGRDFKSDLDSYPINLQEIVLALVNKSNSKSENKPE